MSLFKTRDFWGTNCEEEETFDQNSLLISSLNTESDFIITGSHMGVLRIFKPVVEFGEDNVFNSDLKPTDLVVETILDYPVLQLGVGKLVSGSASNQLVVLHPRHLSVYTLVIKEGATEHGTQNILKLVYDHTLKRSAANFVIGPFGGSEKRDFICVQSLDGMLIFFEQGSFSFCCFISIFLLPGPIVFVKKSDSFITGCSNWCVESYRYKQLCEAGHNSGEDDTSGKSVISDWSFYLNETILDLNVVDTSPTEQLVLILGERNLVCLTNGGRVKFMKRLEYSPLCITAYFWNDSVTSLVVSETGTILIYQNTTLKWSAHLTFLPICIRRANLWNVKGAIVLLSEEGKLECCYLGTEPSLFVAPPICCQELNFQKAEVELASLNKVIQSSYSNERRITNEINERDLSINVQVNSNLKTCTYESNLGNALNNQMCTLTIELIPQAQFQEVQISIFVQKPLKAVPPAEFYSNLSERTSLDCFVFMDEARDVPSLKCEVIGSYVSTVGVPRTVTCNVMLPMNLVLEVCPPQKDAEHKIVMNINKSPLPIFELFQDLIGENPLSESSSAVGFINSTYESKVVTVLLAKSSQRYRVQSDSIASLNLLVEQIIHRLSNYFPKKDDLTITYNASLPMNEVLKYVNRHFSVRQSVISLQNEVSQLSSQCRLIQKRLISKLKMKTPTSLDNLEILINDTFVDLMNASDMLIKETDELMKSQIDLCCGLNLVSNLLRITDGGIGITPTIESTFIPFVQDVEGQSWEDVMDACLCYLLRTSLAKSDKDKLRVAHVCFDEVKDCTKLEKHFSQVLERISKKSVLLNSNVTIDEEVSEHNSPEKAALGIGSKFGESSSRLLSARQPRSTFKNVVEYPETY